MGFRIRKSLSIAPGVRLNFSKTGIGYSVGVKGYRVTQRADGRLQRTASLPGTGISHVTTTGSAKRGASRPAARRSTTSGPPATAAPPPARPGWFAPKEEKALYAALRARDIAAAEQIAQVPNGPLTLAASTIAGLLCLDPGHQARARQLFGWVFATGKDLAADPFLGKYVHTELTVPIAVGVTAHVPLGRAGVGLLLAELHQAAGDLAAAVDVVEQLEPTTLAAVSLAELYTAAGRPADVVHLTDGITNTDDATALLCTFRGEALRSQGHLDAARDAFKEALRSTKREPVIRHRALLERARTYEAEGKRALAKKDLERILAEDSSYDGLAEALRELDDQPDSAK